MSVIIFFIVLLCMSQVVRRSRVVVSNPEPIKSLIHCQRLATAAAFEVSALAQCRGDGPPLTRDTRKGTKRVNED